MAARAWLELRFESDSASWPAVEEHLDELGALAVTQSGGDAPVFGEPGLAPGHWGRFSVEALFPADADAQALIDVLQRLLGEDVPVSIREIADQPWDEVWKANWQPQLFRNGLCVCPSWCSPPPEARQTILLDPGRAFGTGTHETTALCVNWLAEPGRCSGASVVDYGCGSGILALAARACGASKVRAVDIDADAVAAAQENMTRNGATEVEVTEVDGLAPGLADVVVANILLEPLLSLNQTLCGLVRDGGEIALTGLLEAQAAQVQEAYASWVALEECGRDGDWILLSGTVSAPR